MLGEGTNGKLRNKILKKKLSAIYEEMRQINPARFKALQKKIKKQIIIDNDAAWSNRFKPGTHDYEFDSAEVVKNLKKAKMLGVNFNENFENDNRDAKTLLMTAYYPEAVEFLAENGADVNAETYSDKNTALFFSHSPEKTAKLIEKGANVKHKNFYNEEAIIHIDNESKLLLLDAGADINATDRNGNNILYRNTDTEFVSEVVKRGIDLLKPNKTGKNTLEVFEQNYASDIYDDNSEVIATRKILQEAANKALKSNNSIMTKRQSNSSDR